MHTLMLLPWMAPHKVIPWQRAIVLALLGKVEVVVEYDEVVYRRPSTLLRAPAVVRMRAHKPRATHAAIRFGRVNVFRRDGYRCQYCGAELRASQLTFDHVLPRARGGRTDWENIVTCCRPCNDQKRDRTPDEAGMILRRRPQKPVWLPPAELRLRGALQGTPAEWRGFVS